MGWLNASGLFFQRPGTEVTFPNSDEIPESYKGRTRRVLFRGREAYLLDGTKLTGPVLKYANAIRDSEFKEFGLREIL